MPRIILAVRDPDLPDHLRVHNTETAARAELAAYVRRQIPRGRAEHPADDDAAIHAWFDDQRARYAIGEVTAPSPKAGAES